MVYAIGTDALALEPPLAARRGIARRWFDIIFSLLILIIAFPVLLLAIAAILVESPGNPFYLQLRMGLGGKPFDIIKLRTMVPEAERSCGPKLCDKNDSRVTTVGRFLRRTHIDEIPQFINVLRGDMAIVGPRPERPELHAEIIKDIPDYGARLYIKPGITGLAQIRGDYHIDFRHKLRYDLVYIRSQCFLLDLKIMAATLWLLLAMRDSA
jgi:lipopolysaccharide/colanic/teichoic acid biosynthesis glycosyltransferase